MLADTHSHILPKVDDGSHSIKESIAMLNSEKEQGVSDVILTPHLYPERTSLEKHLDITTRHYDRLKSAIKNMDLPNIYLGHELKYFTGISNSEELDPLCIANTKYLLLELPMGYVLTEKMLDEAIKLKSEQGYTVILAHIERYAKDKLFKKILLAAERNEVLLQISSSFITVPYEKKVVKNLVKNNLISFVGSDAHSTTVRPVIIKDVYDFIKEIDEMQYNKCISQTEALISSIKEKNNA